MPSIRASGVGFAHDDAVPLFSELDLHLTAGWTGVVGANGSGKTTLLGVLARALAPQAGALAYEPPDARVVLCAQQATACAPAIAAFAGSTDAAARRLHGRLALDPDALARWASLSPGERRRWQIGAALAAEPDVLLLDEPTNHLDADARGLLLGALARFRGVGVVVSHDRALLDALTRATLRLSRGRAQLFRGGYSAARREWEAAERAERDAHAAAREAHARTARRLADARRALDAASASRSARVRMKDAHDNDARGSLAKGLAAAAEARIGRAAGVLRRAHDRAEQAVESFALERDKGRAVFVGYAPPPVARLCVLEAPRLCAGATELLRGPVNLALGREDRVRVAGPNGAGKSTLLRALVAGARVPAERLLVVPQELDDAAIAAQLAAVRALGPAERARVLSLVAALGADPDRLLRSRAPSPGEARKLAIALGLGRLAWVVALDEPTNHLDLPSIERLEAALGGYPGALLLVTHDEAFARGCAVRTTWRLGGGGALTVES